MSYKALYRTYRPQIFEEVAGQTHIVRTLKNAIDNNKIAHAYLFCGPRGTGKTSIAKIFAKAINCETKDAVRPCMECDNCLSITEGSHPDIIEIDAASNNGVDEVRSLIEKVKYTPIKGKFKVYIIDEVHMMSTGAFNALLKTIEEPPSHVIFILATTEPQKVIPTIISRCQRYDFTKVSVKEMIKRINIVLSSEKIQCSDEAVEMISVLADGGMRDALSILDQVIAYAGDSITENHINDVYGITTMAEKIKIFEAIYSKDAKYILDSVHSFIEKGIDIKRLTNDFIEMLKESIVYDYTKDIESLNVMNQEQVNVLRSTKTTKQRIELIDILMETYEKYRFASNVGVYFEVALLKMISNDEIDTIIVKKEAETKLEERIKAVEVIKAKPVEKDITVKEKTVLSNEDDIIDDISLLDEPVFVSRETITIEKEPNCEVIKAEIPVDYVIKLLVGANKEHKQEIMPLFKNINNYLFNEVWGKYANTLRKAKLFGCGVNYIIISVSNQSLANEINNLDISNDLYDFSIELFGKAKKFFAISDDQAKMVISKFKELTATNTLPDPIEIVINGVKKEESIQKSSVELATELFGEDNLKVEEI